jgi:ABC-type nitrate/sulfonate/bicarbonate transport system permease component
MTFISTLLRALIGLAAVGALYELYANAAQNPLFFPTLGATARRVMEVAPTGEFQRQLFTSAIAFVQGFSVAALRGIVLGLAFGKNAALGWVFGPLVRALAGVPMAAFAALIITWLGFGPQSKMLFVALFATCPIMRTVMVGAARGRARANASAGDATTPVAAGSAQTSRAVLAGLRWGLLLGVTGLLFGEMIGTGGGIGSFINQSIQRLDTTGTMVGFLAVAAPVTLAAVLLEAIEAQLAAGEAWRASGAHVRSD